MINHPSNYPIPLVSFSGIPGTEKLSAFLATQSSSLIDHGHLNLQDPFLNVTLVVNRDTKTDRKSVEVPSVSLLDKLLQPGIIVRSYLDGVPRVSIITHAFMSIVIRPQQYKIRHLNEFLRYP